MTDVLIGDLFAGGGGASLGIEWATGRIVDFAVNHDPAAITMHKANHPYTKHYCENIWEVDPREVVKGRKVALLHGSPDCTHFSIARGDKPKEKKIRSLAWVLIRWAATVRPDVITMENVVEFQTWGPLLSNGKPDPGQKGRTFRSFINAFRYLGYDVDYRELKACDYGAPTTRKRFFLVARCDGKPIAWPKPSHGRPDSAEVRNGLLKPYRTAADIIDWSIPCPSIFDRKKPLAENTMRRIAKGLQKFVFDNPEPFIIKVNHTGEAFRGQQIGEPLQTITSKNGYGMVAPYITAIGQTGSKNRSASVESPLGTIVSKAEHLLVAPFLAKHYGGYYTGAGTSVDDPVSTITSVDHNALVTSHLVKFRGTNIGSPVTEPVHTVTAGGTHIGEVRAFLLKYYGSDIGSECSEPLHTVTTKDRFGLVAVHGTDYEIVDIGMRMLTPRELFLAQSFPPDYIIDRDDKGKPYPKAAQVARCGNSVPPAMIEALVRANLPDLCDNVMREAV